VKIYHVFAQPSRHFLRNGSLWRGVNFEIHCAILSSIWACHLARGLDIAGATLSALWACRIALAVARCSFLKSRRSCAAILTRRSFLEGMACRGLYRHLAKRPFRIVSAGTLASTTGRIFNSKTLWIRSGGIAGPQRKMQRNHPNIPRYLIPYI